MIGKLSCLLVHRALCMILLTATTLMADDAMPIPADKSQLEVWFNNNVKPYTEQKNILDPALVAAEEGFKVIKVKKDGSGDFKTITDAVNSIPIGNTMRVIIYIGGGVYQEKIKVDRTKPFITFYGLPNDMPNLIFSGTAAQYGTVDSATLIVESDYFTAANIVITNGSPRPNGELEGAQAVALRTSGDKASFYNCKIIGFQDTLCDDRGFHFFKDCYIEGTVDFIFGSGTSLYLNTELHVIGDTGLTIITAQAREYENEQIGYSFVHCNITGTGNGTYLGRAWKSRPRVVFSYTSMSDVINPAGWSDNFVPQRDNTVFYGEYKNIGPGSRVSGRRVKYCKELTKREVHPFLSLGYIMGSKWLLPPPNPRL